MTTNYTREWIENAPVRRFTFFDLINAAPGVSPATSTSSRSQSFGSATNENMYLLDGTDFTAPLTGAAWPWPNTDAIEEVQVLSLGAPADYGNLAGAVFNVVTRQGSNTFRGDANFYFQNQSLTGRNTDDEQDDGLPYHRDEFKDATVQLGGPVIKDKFWFFGSYQYQKDADSQPGTDPEFPARSSAKRYFYKLNYQINQDNRLQFQMHDDFYRIPRRATANTRRARSASKPATIRRRACCGRRSSTRPRCSRRGIRASTAWTTATRSTAGRAWIVASTISTPARLPAASTRGTTARARRPAFSGKVTKFADDFLGGSHDFKLGVQYNSGLGEYTYGPNDYIYTYGSTPAYGYTQLPYTQGGRMKAFGIFVDDTYQIGRATLNLGLRYDDSKAYFARAGSARSPTAIPPARSRAPSTRSSGGGCCRRASASISSSTTAARRFSKRTTAATTAASSRASSTTRRHRSRRGMPSRASTALPAARWTWSSSPTTRSLTVDPDLKNPYTDQFILAWEQQARSRTSGSRSTTCTSAARTQTAFPDIGGTYQLVPYTAPAGANVPQVYQLTSGADSRLFQLRNDDRMFSRYNGVAFEIKKRMSNRWQANFGLTLSKSDGTPGFELGACHAAHVAGEHGWHRSGRTRTTSSTPTAG